MKLRSFFTVLGTAIALVLLLAVVSFNQIIQQSPLKLASGGIEAAPRAAMFVSRQAPAMVSLLVNPDRLEGFAKLASSPGRRRLTGREFQGLRESLLTGSGFDYARDIQPWLGEEITLAVTSLDYDRNPGNGAQPGYLLAVQAKDPQLAKEFLQGAFAPTIFGADLAYDTYDGVKLIYRTAPASGIVACAIAGDMVLFANGPKVLREAINNVQAPGLNLEASEAYQNSLKTIINPRIALAYVNLPALSAWIVNKPAVAPSEAEPLLALALSLKQQGLAAETALIGIGEPKTQLPTLGEPVGALQYVPADSIFTAAGADLAHLWTEIETGLSGESPLGQLLAQFLNRLEKPLGLKLREEIFPWVRGEYALALVKNTALHRLDWLFVAQNTPEAAVAIAHLDDLAAQGQLSVGRLPVLDDRITAWTKLVTTTAATSDAYQLSAQVQGVRAAAGNYWLFTTALGTLEQALGGRESLEATPAFQRAIAALPQENDGYLYLDWREGREIFERAFPWLRLVEVAGKPLFDNLRSLTISSIGNEEGVRRATLFLNLEPHP
ncbi:MAG: DUF3352 domain-containing protein [Chloroflexaceae bacterium]|nr:DUF3352 domain-containing protein [Chloroflexaceae bacterium]